MGDVVGLCSICGKPGAMHTCCLCGRIVCSSCYSYNHSVCNYCNQEKT